MRILGLSAYYHDSAAALVIDGRVVAAAQEERFSRIRHDAAFPARALAWCLEEAGLTPADLDRVVFYDKPFPKFERLLETTLAFAPRGFASFRRAVPAWLGGKLFLKDRLLRRFRALDSRVDWAVRLRFCDHHMSHAASAFFPSPFDEAVVLTLDGVGEWATTSVAVGCGNRLEMRKELHFPHSLGLLYSAVTHYLGFRVNSAEYKVMGLAPYGQPLYRDMMLERLIDVKADGSFRLDQRYFNYCTGLTMTSDRFAEVFGRSRRRGEEAPLERFHMDVAASVQAVTEEVMLRLTRSLAAEYGLANLCLAGGVALNCVANGKVLRDGAFSNIWIQPAAGDAGGAVGAALAVWHLAEGQPRTAGQGDGMGGAFLGPAFSQSEIEQRLAAAGARFTVVENIAAATAEEIAAGKVVGWFQGRMEFGPRSLGARSILADPRSPEMQRLVNLKVKNREGFRPFAPAVPREDVAEWFDLDQDSPYMLLVAEVHPRHRLAVDESGLEGLARLQAVRSDIPAVTHVDYSARVQTVHARTNPRFHALLRQLKTLTGCPVVLNTSFNVRGEPIVHTPEEAFRCFMGTGIAVLAIGDCLLRKADQDAALLTDHAAAYGVD